MPAIRKMCATDTWWTQKVQSWAQSSLLKYTSKRTARVHTINVSRKPSIASDQTGTGEYHRMSNDDGSGRGKQEQAQQTGRAQLETLGEHSGQSQRRNPPSWGARTLDFFKVLSDHGKHRSRLHCAPGSNYPDKVTRQRRRRQFWA